MPVWWTAWIRCFRQKEIIFRPSRKRRSAATEGTDYIDFIARRDGELIVVINPDALLSEEDFDRIDELDLSQEEKQE